MFFGYATKLLHKHLGNFMKQFSKIAYEAATNHYVMKISA